MSASHSTLGFLEARHHRPRDLAVGLETVERRSEASLQVVCHRSTRCARRRARRPVHSTRAPPPRTAPAAKHISSQARDRIAPLTLTWRSSSLYAQLNGRNSRKMPKKSKNKTGAATNASAANKRARRAADQPHTADTTTTSTWRQPTRRSSAMCWRRCAPQALTCPPADRSRGRRRGR